MSKWLFFSAAYGMSYYPTQPSDDGRFLDPNQYNIQPSSKSSRSHPESSGSYSGYQTHSDYGPAYGSATKSTSLHTAPAYPAGQYQYHTTNQQTQVTNEYPKYSSQSYPAEYGKESQSSRDVDYTGGTNSKHPYASYPSSKDAYSKSANYGETHSRDGYSNNPYSKEAYSKDSYDNKDACTKEHYSKADYSLGYGSSASSVQSKSSSMIVEHYAPSSSSYQRPEPEPSRRSSQPSAYQQAAFLAAGGQPDSNKDIQKRIMNRMTHSGGSSSDSTHSEKDKRAYDAYYTSFYGMDPNQVTETGEPDSGGSVDPRFAYLYKGFKPKKGTKFTGRQQLQNAPKDDADTLERPCFEGAVSEKVTTSAKARHERYLRMMRVNEESHAESGDSQELWDQKSQAPESLIYSALEANYDHVMKMKSLTSEQRVKELISVFKSTLEKLLVPPTESQFFFEAYLSKMIKEKGWKSLTTSTALFLSVSSPQKIEPLDPPKANYFCSKCKLVYPPEKYQCYACDRKFSLISELYVHEYELHGHLSSHSTMCNQCYAVFPKNPVALNAHYKVNHICDTSHAECPFGCKKLIIESHSRSLPDHVFSTHACIECNDLLSSSLEKHISLFHASSTNDWSGGKSSGPARCSGHQETAPRSDIGHSSRSSRDSSDTHSARTRSRENGTQHGKEDTNKLLKDYSKSQYEEYLRKQSKQVSEKYESPSREPLQYGSSSKSKKTARSPQKDNFQDEMYEKAKNFIDQMFSSSSLDPPYGAKREESPDDMFNRAYKNSDPLLNLQYFMQKEKENTESIPSLISRKDDFDNPFQSISSKESKSDRKETSKRSSKISISALEEEVNQLFKSKKHKLKHESPSRKMKRERLRSKSRSPRKSDKYRSSKRSSSPRRSSPSRRRSRSRNRSPPNLRKRSSSRKRSDSRKRTSPKRAKSRSKDKRRLRSSSRNRNLVASDSRIKDEQSSEKSNYDSGKTIRSRESSRGDSQKMASSSVESRKVDDKKYPRARSKSVDTESISGLEQVSPERPDDLHADDLTAVSPPGSPISDTELDSQPVFDETQSPPFELISEDKATWVSCKLCSFSCPPNGGFQCKQCSKKFTSTTQLYIHMESAHKTLLPTKWDCEFCGSSFGHIYVLDEHVKSCHFCQDEHVQCEHGCTMLLTKKSYEMHCDTVHGFFCDLCNVQCLGSKSEHLSTEHNNDLDDLLTSEDAVGESVGIEILESSSDVVDLDVTDDLDMSNINIEGTLQTEPAEAAVVELISDDENDILQHGADNEVLSGVETNTVAVVETTSSPSIECGGSAKNGLESIEITDILDDAEDLSDAELDSVSDSELFPPGAGCDIFPQTEDTNKPADGASSRSGKNKVDELEFEITAIDLSPYEDKHIEKNFLHVLNNRTVFGECLFVKMPAKHVLQSQSKENLESSGLIYCTKCPLVYHPMLMRCNACEVFFLDETALADHAIAIHKCSMDGETVECRFCDKSFDTYEEVIKHRTSHFCPEHIECSKGCTSLIVGAVQHLKKHVSTYHSKEEKCLILGHVSSDILKSATQTIEPVSENDLVVCADCPVAIPAEFEIVCEECSPSECGAKTLYVVDEYVEHKLVCHKEPSIGYFRCMLCKEQPSFENDITALIDHKHKVHGVCVRHSRCPEVQCHTLKAHGHLLQHLEKECRFFKSDKSPAIAAISFPRKEIRYCEVCTFGVLTSKIYKCTMCPGHFPVLKEFYAHMYYDHERPVFEMEYQCDLCDAHEQPVSSGRWRQHRSKKHGICRTHFACNNVQCHLMFSSVAAVNAHLKSSDKCREKPAREAPESLGVKRCSQCDVIKSETFRRACQLCFNKIFVDDLEFMIHLATKHRKHFSASVLQCEAESCCDTFSDLTNLASHRFTVHNICQTHVFCTARGGTACGYILNLLNQTRHECMFDQSELRPHTPELLWDDKNDDCYKCQECSFKLTGTSKSQILRTCTVGACRQVIVGNYAFAAHGVLKHGLVFKGLYECVQCFTSPMFRDAPERLAEHLNTVHGFCLFHKTCPNRACRCLFNFESDISSHLQECSSRQRKEHSDSSIQVIDDDDDDVDDKLLHAGGGGGPTVSLQTSRRNAGSNISKDSKTGPKFVDLDHFKLFSCTKCSRKFGTSSLVECQRCLVAPGEDSMRYINKDEYNAHVSVNHKLKLLGTYKCPVCEVVFSDDPIKLSEHLNSVHGYCKSHFICPHECLQLFGDPESLEKHLEEMHRA